MVQMFMVNVVLLAAGFFALIKGADWFVDGSSALAKNFHVPGLIIGLTIVALGTSAPELAVSISAALQGSNEIALSNVVGSDVGVGVQMIRAGLTGAAMNVFINTKSMENRSRAEELNRRAGEMIEKGTKKADEIYARVMEGLLDGQA